MRRRKVSPTDLYTCRRAQKGINMNLIVSKNCIGCKRCAEACPAVIIGMKENRPVLTGENCIKCGHCEAICPQNALKNDALNHHNTLIINNHPILDPENSELFLRSRRSIRCFQDKIVSEEETTRLVNIGRYAQTGSNSQGVSYLVISSKEKMEKLRELTMNYFKNHTEPTFQLLHKKFMESERDILFRGAPMCILAMTAKNNSYTTKNAQFALTYIELFAPSLNLGTCWAGYLENYLRADQKELHDLLDIPENRVVSGALLYGYPKYQYHRVTERNELDIIFR